MALIGFRFTASGAILLVAVGREGWWVPHASFRRGQAATSTARRETANGRPVQSISREPVRNNFDGRALLLRGR